MLYGSKEELEGAARILLNNYQEMFTEFMFSDKYKELTKDDVELFTINPKITQAFIESPEWVHVYNLSQRLLFINNRNVHFALLAELEKVSVEENRWVPLRFCYRITNEGIQITIQDTDNTVDMLMTFDIWCIERAIQGLQLNMPSGRKG